ncbi:hypothetical protein BOTBODRAFT_58605 [Botryobasidium botryosum FD-172 SS1]|uniref:F-box domain-containing protein n=1 Tax=Botryobasidium botryosum (strain FD-172 SS1) TaxID=930990 RepID=A0A067M1V0_BOTB1|nr:hypothetical protein BOTBODRAFT_58605 [Botryobasidium botryosum FD-172 SS1]
MSTGCLPPLPPYLPNLYRSFSRRFASSPPWSSTSPISSETHILRLPYNTLFKLLLASDAQQDPLRFSRVCRAWRQCIHAHPTFWSVLRLYVDRAEPELRAAYWLERAGMCPLDILISIRETGYYWINRDPAVEIGRLARVLSMHAERWRNLTIFAFPYHVHILFQHLTGQVSMLERLAIFARAEVTTPFSVRLTRQDLSLIPDNGEISFYGCIPMIHASLGMAITNLRICYDQTCLTDKVISLLLSCPNLTKFQISRSRWELGYDSTFANNGMLTPTIPVPLSHLVERLVPLLHLTELLVDGFDNVGVFFNHLRLPSLRVVHIYGVYWDDAMLQAAINTFESCTQLSTFILRSERWYEVEVDVPLSSAPITLENVKTFELPASPHAYPLLGRLRLPQMQDFTIRFVPLNIAIQLMASSTQLRTVELEGFQWLSSSPPPLLSIPTLSSLILAHSKLECLHFFHTPSLEHLTLEEMYEQSNQPIVLNPLCDFLERSDPPLKTLRLKTVAVEDDDILRSFERLPLLEKLDISPSTDGMHAIFHALARPFSTPHIEWLLPSLNEINVRRASPVIQPAFHSFLDSRNEASAAAGGAVPHLGGSIF